MRLRVLHLVLGVLVVVPVVAPHSLSGPSDAATPGLIEEFRVRLLNITTSYETEAWKYNNEFYARGPVNGIDAASNRSGAFDRALGTRVVLKVQLTDLQDKPIAESADIRNVELHAKIDTPQGPLQAYVSRATASTPLFGSPTFFLNFDIDGSNYAPPPSKSQLALAGGQLVDVKAYRRGVTQQLEPVGGNKLLFYVDRPTQEIIVTGINAPYTTEAPDRNGDREFFRWFNDIGSDDSVLMVTRGLARDANITATYTFAKANATVRFYAFVSHAGCDNPTGCSSPAVNIFRRALGTDRTDAGGKVTFSTTAQDLIRFTQRNFPSGLVVLAANLEPSNDFNNAATLPDGYSLGSPDLLAGATEVVIPIGQSNARVSKYAIDTRLYENASRAPDAFSNAVLQANSLEVQVYDDNDNFLFGDTFAVRPSRGGTPLGSASLSKHADPNFDDLRVSRVPVKGIQDSHVTNYRVLNFLYNVNRDFYGLTWGDRGFLPSIESPDAFTTQQGGVWINLTSVNTNYDLSPAEANFELRVLVRLTSPDIQKNETMMFTLPEGGTVTRQFVISPPGRAVDVKVNFLMTTGDTLSDPLQDTVSFLEKPPKKGFIERIPGFETVAFVAAIAFLLWRRRR